MKKEILKLFIRNFLLVFLVFTIFMSLTSGLLEKTTRIELTPIDAKQELLWAKYPPIKVESFLGFDKADLKLETHTEECYKDCSSEIEITTYEDSALIDNIRFTLNKPKSYKILIQDGLLDIDVNDYQEVCNLIDTPYGKTNSCEKVLIGSHKEKVPNWVEYNIGEIKPKGTYKVKITGELYLEKSVDWIIETQGKELTEWAVWGALEGSFNVQNNYTVTSSTNNVGKSGMQIRTTTALTINNITKHSASGATKAYILDSSKNVLANANFVGNIAQIHYNTTAGTTYYLATDKAGSNFDIYYVTPATYPKVTTYFNWTGGLDSTGLDVANYAFEINSTGITMQNINLIVNNPQNNANVFAGDISFDCTYISPAGTNLVNASIFTNKTGAFQISNTVDLTGTNNRTNITVNLAKGTYNWSCFGCDDSGSCGVSENRTIIVNRYNVREVNYTTPAIETASYTFNLSIDYTGTLTSAILTYNNTNYTTTATIGTGNANFSRVISAPVVASNTNISFYWILFFQEESTFLEITPRYNQSVNPVSAVQVNQNCNDKAYYFNFTDEESLTALYANISYNILYGTSIGNYRTVYGSLNNIGNFSICINSTITPTWYIGYGEIQYDSGAYEKRRYYIFQNTPVTNNTNNVTLYNILSANQQSFKLEVQDISLRPLNDKYTQLLRWYPNLNSYKVVEMHRTDEQGGSVLHVKSEDVDYKLAVYDLYGTLQYLDASTRMACLVNPCTFTVTVKDQAIQNNNYFDISNIFTFNETTGIWYFAYTDNSARTSTMNMTVYWDTGEQYIPICTTTSTGVVGVLICNTSLYNTGTQRAIIYRSASPTEPMFTKVFNFNTDAFTNKFGLWLTWLISLPIVFGLAIISPIAGIVGVVFALIPALYLGSINSVIFSAIAVLAGVIIHFVRRL